MLHSTLLSSADTLHKIRAQITVVTMHYAQEIHPCGRYKVTESDKLNPGTGLHKICYLTQLLNELTSKMSH